jgi:hypothetical protein
MYSAFCVESVLPNMGNASWACLRVGPAAQGHATILDVRQRQSVEARLRAQRPSAGTAPVGGHRLLRERLCEVILAHVIRPAYWASGGAELQAAPGLACQSRMSRIVSGRGRVRNPSCSRAFRELK